MTYQCDLSPEGGSVVSDLLIDVSYTFVNTSYAIAAGEPFQYEVAATISAPAGIQAALACESGAAV